MASIKDGTLGGVVGALAMSVTMLVGRQVGWLDKTLTEDAEGWIDRNAKTRRRLGYTGSLALEQVNHFGAGAAFGALFALLRPRSVSPTLAGAVYGAGLYAVNIAGIAPVLGITEGEQNAPRKKVAERFGLHILFGVVTALSVAALED